MSTAGYRARSATELIDAVFQLMRRDATPLLTLGALVSIPLVVMQATLMHTSPLEAMTAAGQARAQALGGGTWLVYLLLIIGWSTIIQTAMLYASSDTFLGKPVVIADAIKRALPKAVPMFIAYLLMSIAVGIGVIGLFIGAIFVALLVFAVPTLIAFENLGVIASFGRSAELSKGIKGHIFVTCLLAFAIYLVGYLIVMFVGGALGALVRVPAVGTIAIALGTTVLVPIFPVVFTLLYYDARIRKEGFDIQLMAEQVAGGPAPQPAV